MTKSRSLFKQLVDGPVSVADYIEILNASLGEHSEKITGEVTEVKMPSSGHVYFSLKDKGGDALIRCVMWRRSAQLSGIFLEDGMEVVLGGAPNIYAKSGSLSFVTQTVELVGEGALKKQYEMLKAKLTAEGLFAESRKRPLPQYPQKIGVITSKSGGVVIYDYLNNLKKFGFISKIVDTRVEGVEATRELYDSVQTMKRQDIDILVIIRGGGSLESFAPFNNEILVREVASFPVPVIVGVGHHVDVCLSAMAADVMVSTPTAAANLINESWDKAIFKVERAEQSILNKYARALAEAREGISRSSSLIQGRFAFIFERFRETEKVLMSAIHTFDFSLRKAVTKIDEQAQAIFRSFSFGLKRAETRIASNERAVAQGDPTRQLRLGYSIVMAQGKVIRNTSQAAKGDRLDIRVSDGTIGAEVRDITTSKN